MYISTKTKSAIAAAVCTSLTACGGGSSGNDGVLANNPGGVLTENLAEVNTVTDALFEPPQFLTSECGSLGISSASANNNLDTPTQLTVGVPVAGQIVPDSNVDNFDLWQVTLEPGSYHLVVDATTLEDDIGLIGIEIETLATETAENATLVSQSENGNFDLRQYVFLEIQETQTLPFTVEAFGDDTHNYTLGIFSNGSAVPSPNLNPANCVEVATLSLDSTQAPFLPGSQTRDDDLWFVIDLPAGGYQIDASTSNAESTLTGYEIAIFDQFVEQSTEELVSIDFDDTTLLETSDTFQREGNSATWVRLRNLLTDSGDGRIVEFTITSL